MAMNKQISGKSISINPAKLTPYEKNSRIHSSEQIAMIVESIRAYGFLKPVLIDESNMLLAGHGARLAAIELEMTEIPARKITGLTDDEKRGYVVADNRASDLSKWDWEMLTIELGELQNADVDLKSVGFQDFGKERDPHHREGHNVVLGEGRFLLQLEFESEKEMESIYKELDARGLAIKVLE